MSVPDPQIISLAILGSLLPDLDHEHSLIGKVPVLGPLASRVVQTLAGIISVVRPVNNPFTSTIAGHVLIHRGPFHTPVIGFLASLAGWTLGLGLLPAVALYAGYLSHLAADEPTKLGIAWFWPVYQWPIRLPISWRSGNAWIEQPVAFLTLAFATYYCWT